MTYLVQMKSRLYEALILSLNFSRRVHKLRTRVSIVCGKHRRIVGAREVTEVTFLGHVLPYDLSMT